MLEELAHALERIFHDRAVEIDWRCPDDLYFQGERQDLLEILGNVLENACKYSKRRVRLRRRRWRRRDVCGWWSRTTGRACPRTSVEVFKRGERLDESAPGSGLGLSIVDELARAYGGEVALSDSALGGLKVTLDLPASER